MAPRGKKLHTETSLGPPLRCGFVVTGNSFDGMMTVVRDTNAPGKMLVTNDVENVVAKLLRDRTIAPGGKLYYVDSDERTDEIVYDAEGFVRFAPGPQP